MHHESAAAFPRGPAVRPETRRWRAVAALVLVTAGMPLGAQDSPLTLAGAIALADSGAFPNRSARAGTAAAEANRMRAWRGLLPTLRVESGIARTTDPVGAFGTRLRQQRIAATDFSPERLNFPAPISNYAASLVIEQPLVMVDAWLGSRAGGRATASAEHAAEWTRVSTTVEVVRAYYGAVLASERAVTLDSAMRAARAHVRQAEQMLDAGLVTRSDALLAAVTAGSLEADRIAAGGEAGVAVRQLVLLLGIASQTASPALTGFPSDTASVRTATDALNMTAGGRADVGAARSGMAAAAADVDRARSALLPRLVSFARRDFNSSDTPFGGHSNWTLGVMASWTPFSGAGEIAEVRAARARQDGAQAQLDGVMAGAAVDVERTAMELRTALARLEIARQAVTQAAEAHRIVTRKYAGGLATIAELLDASAAETGARLRLSAARFGLQVATAERLRSVGADPAMIAAGQLARD